MKLWELGEVASLLPQPLGGASPSRQSHASCPWPTAALGAVSRARWCQKGWPLLVPLLYLHLSPYSIPSIPLRSQGHCTWSHPTDEKAEAQERHTARMSYTFYVFLCFLVFWPSSVLAP